MGGLRNSILGPNIPGSGGGVSANLGYRKNYNYGDMSFISANDIDNVYKGIKTTGTSVNFNVTLNTADLSNINEIVELSDCKDVAIAPNDCYLSNFQIRINTNGNSNNDNRFALVIKKPDSEDVYEVIYDVEITLGTINFNQDYEEGTTILIPQGSTIKPLIMTNEENGGGYGSFHFTLTEVGYTDGEAPSGGESGTQSTIETFATIAGITTVNLSKVPNNVDVYLEEARLRPGTDYNLVGNQITLTFATEAAKYLEVRLY